MATVKHSGIQTISLGARESHKRDVLWYGLPLTLVQHGMWPDAFWGSGVAVPGEVKLPFRGQLSSNFASCCVGLVGSGVGSKRGQTATNEACWVFGKCHELLWVWSFVSYFNQSILNGNVLFFCRESRTSTLGRGNNIMLINLMAKTLILKELNYCITSSFQVSQQTYAKTDVSYHVRTKG